MVNAPTFVADYEGASWDTTTTPKTTGSFNPALADVLVALVGDEQDSTTDNYAFSSTPGSESWTERAETTATAGADGWAQTATCVLSAGQSGFTVSAARTAGSTEKYGLVVARFSGSDGVGNTAASGRVSDSSAASWSFTTNFDNSAIVCIFVDWLAADGTTRTWRTVNGITPTAGNGAELVYFRNSSNYTVYAAYYSDAGTAGAKTLGLSAPGTTRMVAAAVEVQGSTPATSIPFNPQRIRNRGQLGRDPSETYFQQQERWNTDLVATAANDLAVPQLGQHLLADRMQAATNRDRPNPAPWYQREAFEILAAATLDPPLLGAFADGGAYWHVYNEAADFRPRAHQEIEQRRRDSAPLDQALLEVPTPLPDRTVVTHQRPPWLRIEQVQADQSSAAGGTPYDPTLAPRGRDLNAYVDRREVPQQRINRAVIDPVELIGTGALNAWWSDDPAVAFMAANMPRYPVPAQPAGTPYDPTLAPRARDLNAYVDRREVPQQRNDYALADPVELIGTGALNAWWSDDPTIAFMVGAFPRRSVPAAADPGTPFDPTLAGSLTARQMPLTHASRRSVPLQRRAFVLDDTIVIGTGALVAWWGVDDTISYLQRRVSLVPDEAPGTPFDPTQAGYGWIAELAAATHASRRLVPQQMLRLMDQSSAPVPDMPPELWASLVSRIAETWPVSRDPYPKQRERESVPGMLSTALLEDPLLGAWDDLLRHRTWHTDRREVPQQRNYPDALQPLADPLLVGGAEWRYKLIPVTHKARWVLRQWWQQQMFQGSDPVLFEGTVVGGTFSGPGSTGGSLGGYVVGGGRASYVIGGRE